MRGSLLLSVACLLPTVGSWNLLYGLRRSVKSAPPATASPTDGVRHVAQLRTTRVANVNEVATNKVRTAAAAAAESHVWLENGDVIVQVGAERHTLLSGLAPGISAAAPSAAGGAFLSVNELTERSEHRLSLGDLSCGRFLAGARTKRWWMGPAFGASAADVPLETQFLLCELPAGGGYAVLLPLVRSPVRCTLDGSQASRDAELQLLVQSGDTGVRHHGMQDALYISVGNDPYKLLSEAFAYAPPPAQTLTLTLVTVSTRHHTFLLCRPFIAHHCGRRCFASRSQVGGGSAGNVCGARG